MPSFSPTRLIFGGAGTRILCYAGALRALDRIDRFQEFVGVSAGAIIALLLALGLSPRDIEHIILTHDFHSMFSPDPFAPEHVLEMTDTWGLDDGTHFKQECAKLLEIHGFSPRITFEQLARLTRTRLRILATDIDAARYYEFSAIKTPKVPIIDAIYASCAIPIYFQPARINNKILVDGGIVHSFPLTYFTRAEIEDSIGFQILSPHDRCIPRDSFEYFWRICGLILHPPVPYRVPANIYTIKVNSFFLNWNLGDAEKAALVNEGYQQTLEQRRHIYKGRRHSF